MRLEGLRRVGVPEIAEVQIAVFKDRVEIRSPGGLYGGLIIEQIKKEQVSKRRNEIIANMFHEVHFVEKWGRGIGLILYREPDTDFKEVGEIFITMFPRKGIKKTAPETREKKYPEKVGERWSEKWSETLSKRQIEILKLIMNNPIISRKELSKSIGINQSAIQKHLDKLKQAGILERIGPAKGGYWEVREGWL